MMSEAEVLTEVPASLKLLVRIIMRCFYGDEHAVVMDKLIHHPCIKEDDLLDLLRFERKQLRAVITTLRNEKVRVSIITTFAMKTFALLPRLSGHCSSLVAHFIVIDL